jgi:hypothetical protein
MSGTPQLEGAAQTSTQFNDKAKPYRASGGGAADALD